MTLYSLRTDGDQYRITKFTNDLDVQSSYLLSKDRESGTMECDCPAGHHFSCRHRQMFPHLLPILNSDLFWHFEQNYTCDANGNLKSPRLQTEPTEPEPIDPHEEACGVDLPEAILPPAKSSSWRRI